MHAELLIMYALYCLMIPLELAYSQTESKQFVFSQLSIMVWYAIFAIFLLKLHNYNVNTGVNTDAQVYIIFHCTRTLYVLLIARWHSIDRYTQLNIVSFAAVFWDVTQCSTSLTIFRRFPTTFRRFPKILQNLSEGRTNVDEHFPKITEDC